MKRSKFIRELIENRPLLDPVQSYGRYLLSVLFCLVAVLCCLVLFCRLIRLCTSPVSLSLCRLQLPVAWGWRAKKLKTAPSMMRIKKLGWLDVRVCRRLEHRRLGPKIFFSRLQTSSHHWGRCDLAQFMYLKSHRFLFYSSDMGFIHRSFDQLHMELENIEQTGGRSGLPWCKMCGTNVYHFGSLHSNHLVPWTPV